MREPFSPRAGRAAIETPTYGLYRIVTELERADVQAEPDGAAVLWVCNPNNPTGDLRDPAEIVAAALAHPEAAVVVDEAYFEYAGATCVPLIAECPNLIVLRTLSKAFGLAALRVGWAIATSEVAAELESRRPPASICAPAARIAAAALREPRLEVEETLAERERVQQALAAAGYDCRPGHGNFVFVRGEQLAARLEQRGLVVREFPEGIRITLRRRRENDILLDALGAAASPSKARDAFVVRTSTETALRLSLDLDGRGRARIETGIGFVDHLLTLLAFHAGFDLELLASGDLDVDEHHTVEDVLAAFGDALGQALGTRDGVARYGASIRPDGRGDCQRSGRPRPASARRDRPDVRRRSDRRARSDATAARARALRDASRDHRPRLGLGQRRPSRRRSRLQGARPRARSRPARDGGGGVRSTKGLA